MAETFSFSITDDFYHALLLLLAWHVLYSCKTRLQINHRASLLGGDVADDADAVLVVELEEVGEQRSEDDHDQLDRDRERAFFRNSRLKKIFVS